MADARRPPADRDQRAAGTVGSGGLDRQRADHPDRQLRGPERQRRHRAAPADHDQRDRAKQAQGNGAWGFEMPWFPEFASAVELARRQTRAAGQADPVGQYFTALNEGDTQVLETVWPGEVVIYDPRAGEVRGHRQLRRFVSHNLSWLAGLHTRTETVACTVAGGRAVVELLAPTTTGRELAWPVAVVAESQTTRRWCCTYCEAIGASMTERATSLGPPILRGARASAPVAPVIAASMDRRAAARQMAGLLAKRGRGSPRDRRPVTRRAAAGDQVVVWIFQHCYRVAAAVTFGLEHCAGRETAVSCARASKCA